MSRRAVVLTGLGVASALALTACGAQGPAPVDPNDFHGAVLERPLEVPDVELVDTAGQRFNLRTTPTKPLTLVFFGYTHCPDVCLEVLADVATMLQRLTPAQRARCQVIFIATDPPRDDPATVRAFLDRFDPTFIGLTGPTVTIGPLADALGVPLQTDPPDANGGYTVTHGAHLSGIALDHRVHVAWTHPTSVADLTEDVVRFTETDWR